MDHHIWMSYFGKEIRASKRAWADKKRSLAREYDYSRNLEQDLALCNGDQMDIDDPMGTVDARTTKTDKHTLVPLSDEWFTDLDESFNNIDKLLEELQHEGTQISSEDYHQILGADQRLFEMQEDMTQCLKTLGAKEGRPGSNTPERGDLLPRADGDCCPIQTHLEERDSDSHKTTIILASMDPFFVRTRETFCHSGSHGAPMKSTASYIQLSPGENVMKQLFRWWRPCGSGCVRGVRRIGEDRVTEVDGFIQ
ncbi:hypothetical protein N0V82_006350 [Gnomoniopsis sp. IMI 355080]|nr:hypothetical protein N0V82_006350 [Gnomoniopsis sp. IMI 355080]